MKETEQQRVKRMIGQGAGVTTKSEAQLKHLRKIHASLIPAPRKSVKRMMFETMVDFFARLFSSEEGNPPNKVDDGCFHDGAPCRRKARRICPYRA